MAQIVDLIRAGSIATAADLVAGHFLAGHQALVDRSWSQARFLEVALPEEQSATSASILLEARKHAKTNFKMESPDAWYPNKGWQRGWFGGGKGKWESDKGRGKGKKGGKFKDRGGWPEKEGKGKAKWKETRDKGEKEKE